MILVVGFIALSTFASLWTERLWFGSVRTARCASTLLGTRVLLFVVFGVLMAGAVALNIALAYRCGRSSGHLAGAGRPRPLPPGRRARPRAGWWSALSARHRALRRHLGRRASGAPILLWRNGKPFGAQRPRTSTTTSASTSSTCRGCTSWSTSRWPSPWSSLLVAAVVHYLFGGIRLQSRRDRFVRAAQAQLSVLVGLFVLVKAADYWLDRFDLPQPGRRPASPASTYTADNAVLPAKQHPDLASRSSARCCSSSTCGGAPGCCPALGLALLVLSAVLLGMIWPGIVQQFQVKPDEPDKEAPYIEKNIDATRAAYGIDDVGDRGLRHRCVQPAAEAVREGGDRQPRHPAGRPAAGRSSLRAAAAGARLLLRRRRARRRPLRHRRRREPSATSCSASASSTRTACPASSQNWANLHTVYTHGYGLIAAYGNQRPADNREQISDTDNDDPAWAEDQPAAARTAERTVRGRLRGRGSTSASRARSTPSSARPRTATTSSSTCRATATPTRRPPRRTTARPASTSAASSTSCSTRCSFGDANLVLSGRVHENSKILYDRSPRERVEKVAPWLTVDERPVPGGRRRPDRVDRSTATPPPTATRCAERDVVRGDDLRRAGPDTTFQTLPTDEINYMRNAVKATVDAYDGTVTLYAWDEEDPILQAWADAFPGTVRAEVRHPGGRARAHALPRGPVQGAALPAGDLPRHRRRRRSTRAATSGTSRSTPTRTPRCSRRTG